MSDQRQDEPVDNRVGEMPLRKLIQDADATVQNLNEAITEFRAIIAPLKELVERLGDKA